MNCAFCKSDIEDDSFFCDQCGTEVTVCEKCGQPSNEAFCNDDGGAVLKAREKKNKPNPDIQAPDRGIVSEAKPEPPKTPAPPVESQRVKPLQLINDSLNLALDILPGHIVGRTTGQHSEKLKQQAKISGKHVSFDFDPVTGWYCIDLGSTNGTKYSTNAQDWSKEPKLPSNTKVSLANNGYLLVANVEFMVRIPDPIGSATTERI